MAEDRDGGGADYKLIEPNADLPVAVPLHQPRLRSKLMDGLNDIAKVHRIDSAMTDPIDGVSTDEIQGHVDFIIPGDFWLAIPRIFANHPILGMVRAYGSYMYRELMNPNSVPGTWRQLERDRLKNALDDWRSVVKSSLSYRDIDGNVRQARELSLPESELFRQAYTEWIDAKVEGKGLRRALEDSGAVLWDDQNWAPIEEAMDGVFRARGLLKR